MLPARVRVFPHPFLRRRRGGTRGHRMEKVPVRAEHPATEADRYQVGLRLSVVGDDDFIASRGHGSRFQRKNSARHGSSSRGFVARPARPNHFRYCRQSSMAVSRSTGAGFFAMRSPTGNSSSNKPKGFSLRNGGQKFWQWHNESCWRIEASAIIRKVYRVSKRELF